jgi:hypothetical protein
MCEFKFFLQFLKSLFLKTKKKKKKKNLKKDDYNCFFFI